MAEPKVDFFSDATMRCPYPAYEVLRKEAPVWFDAQTGMYTLSSYADIRRVLADPIAFPISFGDGHAGIGLTQTPEELLKKLDADEQELQLENLYRAHGVVPVPTLPALDGPIHSQQRRLFSNTVFKPSKIRDLYDFVEAVSNDLFDKFIDNGYCEWIEAFAAPQPLYVICKYLDIPHDDMPLIKKWTDAWIKRIGLMQSFEERLWSVEQEIEAQQYFRPIIDRLRAEPNDSALSALVNAVVPEWGRPLTDAELLSEIMQDLFVGGAETTANALAGGVRLLIEQPGVLKQLKSDPEKYLPTFVEEVVRLESPVQGLFRVAAVDTVINGVDIPAGSALNLRYASANRDEKQYAAPDIIDLERSQPQTHLGYGFGIHFCLGAPLARRELYFGFKTLVERIEDIWYLPDMNEFEYYPNFVVRSLKELHVGFRKR